MERDDTWSFSLFIDAFASCSSTFQKFILFVIPIARRWFSWEFCCFYFPFRFLHKEIDMVEHVEPATWWQRAQWIQIELIYFVKSIFVEDLINAYINEGALPFVAQSVCLYFTYLIRGAHYQRISFIFKNETYNGLDLNFDADKWHFGAFDARDLIKLHAIIKPNAERVLTFNHLWVSR